MEVNDYLLSHEGLDWHALIEPWRWIFPEEVEFQPWLMNKFGDLTWIEGTGAVLHLNVANTTPPTLRSMRSIRTGNSAAICTTSCKMFPTMTTRNSKKSNRRGIAK